MKNLYKKILIPTILILTNCASYTICIKTYPVVDYERIKYEIATLETAHHPNQYRLTNRFGYMGKYQFHHTTLRTLGFTNKEIKRFLKDPILQEKAMNALVTWNYNYLNSQGLFDCCGQQIGGITITREGMLAGAHLMGALAVEHFMLNDGSMETVYYKGTMVYKHDANGTPLTKYLKIFER